MSAYFNTEYPSIGHLKAKAKLRIPRFAFEYLDGGANEEINMVKNHDDFREIEFLPEYIKDYHGANFKKTLFGREYDAPFGVAPIGLQGLIWPNSPEILAKAAVEQNIPFILSTVSTSSIERISKITDGNFWFQLYHPAKDELRDDLLKRAEASGCEVLVLLADTPTFGLRYKDIKNGLSMPPKMSVRNMLQIMVKPEWALKTLYHGQPGFQSLTQYMDKGLNLSQLGKFMNETFNGRLNEDKIKAIRDRWKGKLVIKGIVNEVDLAKVSSLGADGIIISNHGGRQIDAGESTIHSLQRIAKKSDLVTMIDGGMRSGVDIAKSVACGADFTFMGRPFMYGVGALGANGGHHTINMFKTQLKQVMEQLGCHELSELPARRML
jgi:L-lactate dehydrogenase (cytochrome)